MICKFFMPILVGFVSNCFSDFDNNLVNNSNNKSGIECTESNSVSQKDLVIKDDLILTYEVTDFLKTMLVVLNKGEEETKKYFDNLDNFIMVPATGKISDKFNNFVSNASVSNVYPFAWSFMGNMFFDNDEAWDKYIRVLKNNDSKTNFVLDLVNFDIVQEGFFGKGNFSDEFQKNVLISGINFALKKCIIANWISIYNLAHDVLMKKTEEKVTEEDVDSFIDSLSSCYTECIKEAQVEGKDYIKLYSVLDNFSESIRDYIPYTKDLAKSINNL